MAYEYLGIVGSLVGTGITVLLFAMKGTRKTADTNIMTHVNLENIVSEFKERKDEQKEVDRELKDSIKELIKEIHSLSNIMSVHSNQITNLDNRLTYLERRDIESGRDRSSNGAIKK